MCALFYYSPFPIAIPKKKKRKYSFRELSSEPMYNNSIIFQQCMYLYKNGSKSNDYMGRLEFCTTVLKYIIISLYVLFLFSLISNTILWKSHVVVFNLNFRRPFFCIRVHYHWKRNIRNLKKKPHSFFLCCEGIPFFKLLNRYCCISSFFFSYCFASTIHRNFSGHNKHAANRSHSTKILVHVTNFFFSHMDGST